MKIKGFRWKLEVFKMALYIYGPIMVWYAYNTDYYQKNYVYPDLKKRNYEMYKKLMLDELLTIKCQTEMSVMKLYRKNLEKSSLKPQSLELRYMDEDDP